LGIFSKTQSGSGFYVEIFVTLLNAFMQENKFLKFLGFMWNHVMGYGSCRIDGYSVGQWTSMVIYFFYLVLALMLSLVLFCLCFLLSFSFLALITILCEIHIQGQPPDWEDFLGILFLLIVNSTIRFIEENNDGNAAAALMAHRAPKTKVCLQHLFDLCQSCCQGVVK